MFGYLPWSDLILEEGDQVEAAMADLRLSFAVIMIGLFALSALIIFRIPSEPGANPRDPMRRKLTFWILGLVASGVLIVPYIMGVRSLISEDRADWVATYYQDTFMWAGIFVGAYVVAGFILSKIFLRRTKYGDVFGRRLNR